MDWYEIFGEKNSKKGTTFTGTKSSQDTSNLRVNPFAREEGDQEYYCYDLANILQDVEFRSQTVAKAQNLLKSKMVALDSFTLIPGNADTGTDSGPVADISGHAKGYHQNYPLRIKLNEEKLIWLGCRYPGEFYDYHNGTFRSNFAPKPNAYLTALLLLAWEYIKEHNPGDATDKIATRLIDQCKGNLKSLVPLNASMVPCDNVKLEPCLELDKDGLKASFKLGKGKTYVVRDLWELVRCQQSGARYTLGSRDRIDFAVDSFAPEDRALYDFIRELVDYDIHNYKYQQQKHPYYYYMEPQHSCLPLFGRRLDTFFTLNLGKTLKFSDKLHGDKRNILLLERDLESNLIISPELTRNGDFRGIRVTGSLPILLAGMEYAYFLCEEGLCRTTLDRVKNILDLARSCPDGKLDFKVGRKKLNDFYRKVLPALGDTVNVVEEQPELIEQYLLPEVKFSFYLDYRDSNIYCKAMAHYGEEAYNLLEALSGQVLPMQRDAERENQIAQLLHFYFHGIDTDEGTLVIENNDEAMFAFLEQGVSQLLEQGEVSSTEAFKRLKVHKKARLNVGVSLDGGLMDLEITSEDLSPEDLVDILYSFKRKRRFYRLRNGSFFKADDENLEEMAQLLETLQLAPKDFARGKMQVPAYRALYLDKMLEKNQEVYASRDQNFRQLLDSFNAVGEEDFKVPRGLEDILKPYQVYGYKWLRCLAKYGFGGILADDMGLGKTLQSISVLLATKQEGDMGTSLIVCPSSLVYNWYEEFQRYAPEIRLQLVTGSQKERAEKIAHCADYDVLITSYDLLKRDVLEYESHSFNYQFIDEAQFIKNHTNAAAKSVKTIKAVHKFALTGTPIENRLSELWSLFDYLMPGFLYTYSAFREELELPIVKGKEEETSRASQRLKQLVSPFILRRLKQDVLQELPELIEEVRIAKFAKPQQVLYDGQVARTLKLVQAADEQKPGRGKIEILAELTKLRQICCDPSLLFENYTHGSAKRELCLELVKSAVEGEHKVLIFSQFKSMLELLEQDLRSMGIDCYKITGATPKEQRLQLVHSFNEDATPVFLISLKAGGTGLNLTGADVVIHYDPWWNLAATNQATDRAHRIGQTKVVSVYKLIAKNSIEEKILRLQEAKSDLAENVLSAEGVSSIFNMSKEELLSLL